MNLGDRHLKTQQEEEEEANTKKPFLGVMKKDLKKEKEEKDEEGDKEKEEEPAVNLKPLFKFECDVTENRQVSCMDINSANPDLVAVGYGEFDIDCT